MLYALPPAGVPIRPGELRAGLLAGSRGADALEEYTADVRRTFSISHALTVSSGRAALSLLLQGLHALSPGRTEVALPAYTSFSVPSAVVNAGLDITLYDVAPETLSPVPESLARAVSGRTLAVVSCHLFGYLADLDLVREVAGRVGAAVVDDAAQAMGALFRGRPAGTCGDAGIFSLSRGKNINAVDGGIIVTDRDDLAEVLAGMPVTAHPERFLRLFAKALVLSLLSRPRVYWMPRALPFLQIGASVFAPDFPVAPFTPFQAGIARRMLARLPELTADRRKAGRFFREGPHLKRVILPRPLAGTEPVYLRFPFLTRGGQPPREAPELGIVRSYPESLHRIAALRNRLVSRGDSYPGAERMAASLLTLPTHQDVSPADRLKIARFVAHAV